MSRADLALRKLGIFFQQRSGILSRQPAALLHNSAENESN